MPTYSTPRYKVPRTVTRPITTFKCRWVNERTPKRVWGAKSAARAICAAFTHGTSMKEIEAEVEVKCGGKESRPKSAAEEAMAQAIEALTGSNEELLNSYKFFLFMNGLLIAALAAATLLNIAGIPLRVVAVAARTSVAVLIRVNIRQRAANDAAIETLKRAVEQVQRAA